MSYNPLEYLDPDQIKYLDSMVEALENGRIEFLSSISWYYTDLLVSMVRTSPRRKEIIDGFISRVDEIKSDFAYELLYDREEYKEVVRRIIAKKNIKIDRNHLMSMLVNTSLGREYLFEEFDLILERFQVDLDFIFDYLFDHKETCKNLIERLKTYSNVHIRSLFMIYLIINDNEFLNEITGDINKYLIGMSPNDVCEIAYTAFRKGKRDLFQILKEYIFKNFETNNLAKLLLEHYKVKQISDFDSSITGSTPVDNRLGVKEVESDAERYFKTASTWRIEIFENFSHSVSKELLEDFRKYLLFFRNPEDGSLSNNLRNLDRYDNLTRKLQEYVDKYLALSQNQTHEYIRNGSTASCYRIGDYVFKLVYSKYSNSPILCPDMYLILPNLEEIFVRDDYGTVKAGIEVQKYLKRSAQGVPSEIFALWEAELKKLGYYASDRLIGGNCGDNTMLLDSYKEVKVKVPNWFKKYPLVLVDRDLVYPIDGSPRIDR